MDGIIPELEGILRPLQNPVLCFSGGLDSTVLLRNLKEYCPDFTVLFVNLPMNSQRQIGLARDIAEFFEIPLRIETLGWGDLKGIENNGPDRCYICKRAIYSLASEIAKGGPVLSGDNMDDMDSERPGHRAGKELGVLNPFKDASTGKARIKKALAEIDLPFVMVKDTCMATRYPEGTLIGEKEMRFAEECEAAVRKVSGLKQVRVRINGERALVQTDESELGEMVRRRTQITYELKARGLDCDLDLNAYRKV